MNCFRTSTTLALACVAGNGACAATETVPASQVRPNVIVLLTDDLGYGDVGCYGAAANHVKTPNIDRLAAEGIRFTDGHSASSVCTPSRWSLLTGNYAYRSTKGGSMILPGDAPLTIPPGSFTLPALFQKQGYATGIVGKWHLGLGNPKSGSPKVGDVNWNGVIKPGPLEIGFESAFIIPATGDRVPTVFVHDHGVAGFDPKDPITVSYKGPIGKEPTGRNHIELATVLKNNPGCGHNDAITEGVSRIGFMTGGRAALWKDADISDTLAAESIKFIETNKGKPFFLYFTPHGIHEPRIPHSRFAGKSGCGTYGDHILELDDLVGQLMTALKRLNLDEKTLIVFTSDNGGTPWLAYNYGKGKSLNGHNVNGVLRGEKGTVWEGGTRIPFMVRWPGKVPAGKVSPALVSQTDLMASFARLMGVALPDDAACDSMDVLDALLGKSETGRRELVEHKYSGFHGSALRQDNWKYINGQLYDLSSDLSEKNNLSMSQPERVQKMAARLKELGAAKKTRP